MTQPIPETFQWTTADLELLPDDGGRYEIIDGELFVTRAPHWGHQQVCGRVFAGLDDWSQSSGLGCASVAPGIIFSDTDNVIPDVVWASHDRLATALDDAGHLTAAPELIVEVLSPGTENERRDRNLKLRLYGARGVLEYWIINHIAQTVEVYRRDKAMLKLVATLLANDEITSPILPEFRYPVARLFS